MLKSTSAGEHETAISTHDGMTDIMTSDNGKVQHRTINTGKPLIILYSLAVIVVQLANMVWLRIDTQNNRVSFGAPEQLKFTAPYCASTDMDVPPARMSSKHLVVGYHTLCHGLQFACHIHTCICTAQASRSAAMQSKPGPHRLQCRKI